MTAEREWSLCLCSGFVQWFDTAAYGGHENIHVCRCGHPGDEHLRGSGSCTGEVMIHGGAAVG